MFQPFLRLIYLQGVKFGSVVIFLLSFPDLIYFLKTQSKLSLGFGGFLVFPWLIFIHHRKINRYICS